MAVNPSGQGLKRFLETAPDDQEGTHLRDEALVEAVLQPTTMRRLPMPETTATT